jgi:superfamily II DNA or RNA helicase
MYHLRPYQEEALARSLQSIDGGNSPLLVLATGLGKTVVFCHIAEHYVMAKRNVLVLAHRKELIEQACEKMTSLMGGHRVDIEMAMSRAEAYSGGGRVVVASKDTLRGKRLSRWPESYFDLIVCDEAHHAVAQGYLNIFAHFRTAKKLGVTATPDRADGTPLGAVFNDIAYEMNLVEAIDEGWLVPVHQHLIDVQGLDLSKVREDDSGDFKESELEAVVNTDEVILQIVKPTLELAGSRPVLFFAVSVKQAKHITDVANSIRRGCCEYIASYRFDEETGATVPFDPKMRSDEIKAFRDGHRQCLASCGVFLEGFDAPNAAVIAMARPTKSRPLYCQALGRGTRPLGGVVDGLADSVSRRLAIANSSKPNCLVLDFVGNSGKHKLIHAADVIFAGAGDDYLEQIRATLAKKGGDVQEAAKDVRATLERLAAEQQERAMKAALEGMEFMTHVPRFEEVRQYVSLRAGVNYSSQFIPVGGDRPSYATANTGEYNHAHGPSQKQVELLMKLGVSEEKAKSFSKRQAGAVLDELLKKRNNGPPSSKMAYAIRKAGYDVPETWTEAKAILDKIHADEP